MGFIIEDNLENRLKCFSGNFSNIFHATLLLYNEEASGGSVKPGEIATRLKGISNFSCAAAGAGVGAAIAGGGGASSGAKVGSLISLPLEKLLEFFGKKHHKAKSIRVTRKIGNIYAFEYSNNDIQRMMEILSSALVEIFGCYEHQLIRVDSKEGWEGAMFKSAKDAVARIMNYTASPESESCHETDLMPLTLEGVLNGKSKNKKVQLNYLKGGIVVNDPKKWPLHEMWTQPGVIIDNRYLTLNNTDPNKHQYRHILQFEKPNLNSILNEIKDPTDGAYSYQVKSDFEKYKHFIFEVILPDKVRKEIISEEIKYDIKITNEIVLDRFASIKSKLLIELYINEEELYNREPCSPIEKNYYALNGVIYDSKLNQITFHKRTPAKKGFFSNLWGLLDWTPNHDGSFTPMEMESTRWIKFFKQLESDWEHDKKELGIMITEIEQKITSIGGTKLVRNKVETVEKIYDHLENCEPFNLRLLETIKQYKLAGETFMEMWQTLVKTLFTNVKVGILDTSDAEQTYRNAKENFLDSKYKFKEETVGFASS